MDALKRERAGTLSEPLARGGQRRIEAWRRRPRRARHELAPAQRRRAVRRRIDRHGDEADELVESPAARARTRWCASLLVLVPDGDDA